MCTLIILNQVHPDFPVIIAANRDEYYSRESRPPSLLGPDRAILAGLDEVGGGTWLGATKSGFLVALTNQRSEHPVEVSKRSRGLIVLDALRANSVEAVCQQLEALHPSDSNPFNLLFGTAQGLKIGYCHSEQESIRIMDIPRGVQVLPNGSLNDAKFTKVARCHSELKDLDSCSWAELQTKLIDLLGDHQKPSLRDLARAPSGSRHPRLLRRQLDALCVHAGVYGTCSATLLALNSSGLGHYQYAAGAPCEASFEDYSHLLRD
jgi:uncharacterized protein with NRDE domain